MAAGLVLAAGLASACSGGGSGGSGAAPTPTEPTDPAPTEPSMTRDPEGCTDASATCLVTSTAADGTMTVTLTTNTADAAAMTNTRRVITGTTATITVTSTAEGHANRMVSVSENTGCSIAEGAGMCTGTAVLVRRYEYDADGDLMTTLHYEMGRLMRRVSGELTTTIAYSSSGGGRTETTVTSAGTRVQTFSQYSGGTATTVFTSTSGLIVTTMSMDAMGMPVRVQTTYANAADAMNMENPTEMTVGPAADADTGFEDGETVTRTVYSNTEIGGRTLVATAYTMEVGGDDPEAVSSRTYITATDAQGRETQRRTFMVDASNAETTVIREVATTYPEAGGMEATTTEGPAGSVTRTTVVTTAADGEVTTVVRDGGASDDITTTTVVSSDGNTVATTYGPGYATMSRRGQTDTAVTGADGTVVTTTSTGTGDSRVVSMMVTRDELGAETMRVAFDGNNRETTSTAYMAGGGSTVTTVSATRADADSEYEDTGTVVVTRDPMNREVLRVTMDEDGETTGTTTTVYAADGSSTADADVLGRHRRHADGRQHRDAGRARHGRDRGHDHRRHRDPSGRAGPRHRLGRAVRDDPDRHGHSGRAARPSCRKPCCTSTTAATKLSTALRIRPTGRARAGWDVEVELITAAPACSGSSCTYQNFGSNTPPYIVEPTEQPEVRIYRSDTDAYVGREGPPIGNTNIWSGRGFPDPGLYWSSFGAGGEGWDNNLNNRQGPTGRAIMFRLLADLLGIGGAGVTAEYTAPEDLTADPRVADNLPKLRPSVEIGRAAATALERNTFTDLKTTGLPTGVVGIGRQVKEVDSYLRLGGTRGDDADDASDDVAVGVKVENYFGWMANSMFTVRRVTANGVAGERYDWLAGAPAPGATDEVRAYLAMASGDPSGRPTERSADGMTDPGTWTGSMLGVGSIQGERYRGRAMVSVDFDTNGVTTAFDQIRLATDFDADLTDENLGRIQHVHAELRDGISFESAGILSDGSFSSSMLMDGAFTQDTSRNDSVARISQLDGQFYGEGAAEVAGTFTAYHLALGKKGQEATDGYRGDIVGAFGAARDPMTEAEDN